MPVTRTTFRKGYDPRRHVFTKEECRRGGLASWARTMAEVRLAMGLPLPLEKVREAAKKILGLRKAAKVEAAEDMPF